MFRESSKYKGKRRTRRIPVGIDEDDEIPEVYREMLAEADARAATQEPILGQPLKRRRVGERVTGPRSPEDGTTGLIGTLPKPIQMAIDSDMSDDSDMEWEEVDIKPRQFAEARPSSHEEKDEVLQINFDQETTAPKKHAIARRKPLSVAEKKFRLDIHKFHLLCLLGHVQIRNHWCNDDEVQSFLRKMLPKQTVTLLNPKENISQFTRSTTFIDGLRQTSEIFRNHFTVNVAGLRRPYWAEDEKYIKDLQDIVMRDFEEILSIEDFRSRAKLMRGSRDFGAQLFCSLLRSTAVETRLVCSLQPLPFTGEAKSNTPVKSKSRYIIISDDTASSSDDKSKPLKSTDGMPKRVRRITLPQFNLPAVSKSQPKRKVELPQISPQSPHPVFWIEAYNEAVQKWISVDPFVTQSIAKPSKLEPPASDRYNAMSYVVAFEEDASARDVTRRYAKAYNAKTMKNRVESRKGGQLWWQKTIGIFERPFQEDRDAFEVNELTARTASEPMPRNIQDFKGHPVYALERHLRRNEVIYPKRSCGQVSIGKSGSKNEVEPVYRRSDLHVVRSADGWYRLGRDLNIGEHPLKRVPAIRTGNDEEEDKETPLYAYFQTKPYQPPPVIQGKIPKNAYGNLDIFTPSMVPSGARHIKHPDAALAAKILGIDYADAVTGFDFKGRRGTAVVHGIVTAEQYCEGLEAVIDAINDTRIEEELNQKSHTALMAWKRFLVKLRIAQQVKSYAVEGEESDEAPESDSREDLDDFEHGGGFFQETDQVIAEPTGIRANSLVNPLPEEGSPTIETAVHLNIGGGFTIQSPTAQSGPAASQVASSSTSSPQRLFSKSRPRYNLVVVPMESLRESSRLADLTYQHDTFVPSLDEPGSSVQAPLTIDSSTAKSSTNSIELVSRPPSPPASERPTLSKAGSSSNSDFDETSLLSHDPEDEDAEPEWLMSD